MQAIGVDPRLWTSATETPRYRVDFHDADGSADEWLLWDVSDVEEVFEWTRQVSAGRTFVVYAEALDTSEPILVRLYGSDPNTSAD